MESNNKFNYKYNKKKKKSLEFHLVVGLFYLCDLLVQALFLVILSDQLLLVHLGLLPLGVLHRQDHVTYKRGQHDAHVNVRLDVDARVGRNERADEQTGGLWDRGGAERGRIVRKVHTVQAAHLSLRHGLTEREANDH